MGACQGLAQQVQGQLEEGAACRAPDVQARVKEAGPGRGGPQPASTLVRKSSAVLSRHAFDCESALFFF